MNELEYIISKYNLTIGKRSPIQIRNLGRDQFVENFRELGYKVGVEIGTQAGLYAETICKANPLLKLYCIDPWQSYKEYRDVMNQLNFDNYYKEAVERLSNYNVSIIKKNSMDAVKDFEDGSLDFVYIDGNHEWPYVTYDIYYWEKKVRHGGIIAGHDYYESKTPWKCHVLGAVHGYTRSFWIHPWFIMGIKEMNPGEIRDRKRSWFWVKK